MSTAASALREWVTAALRHESVALAAEYDADLWASETVPHVFIGKAGFLGARNRGRLPFFEIDINSQTFGDDTGEGGTLESTVAIRLHDTGRDIEATQDRMFEIMTAAISSIRDNREYNYTQIGTDAIEAIQPGPMGWMINATLTIQHSYDRDTYEQI